MGNPILRIRRQRTHNIDKIRAVGCPLLSIHGARDRIVPIASGRTLYDVAAQPKEWYEVDGAGARAAGMRCAIVSERAPSEGYQHLSSMAFLEALVVEP